MNSLRLAARPVSAGLVALVCLWIASPACLADTTGAPKKLAAIEGITEYQLDNGLRVLLFPDPSTATVTVNLTVLVGSRHEGYGETGMAHLLEHMVFKGTPTHKDIPKALRDHGAQFNGSTWVDRTNYYETMPATDENLEFGLRLEADRLVNSHVKREDLLSEFSVVRSEFEAGENNPDYILSQRMMAVAYEWHNYGKSTIGNRSDIERVPIDNLQAFYRRFYQPDNCVLVVSGKFDEAKALGYIDKYFGVLKRPTRKLDLTYTEEPAQDGERTVVLRRVGKIGVVGAIYHIPAAAHEDFPAVQVLNNVLVSEPSGRLYKALVPTKKATSVSGAAMGWHDPGVIELSASVDPTNSLETARDTMLEVLENLATQKIDAEEVDRARRQLLKNRELLMTSTTRVAIELSEWAAKGDWRLFFLHRDRIAKVTPADVTRVAERYLQRNNRTVGLYIPAKEAQRASIPATPSVAELVKDYKGTESVAVGEAFDPTPANIEKRVQRSQLASGVKVAILPKKSRAEAVSVDLTLRYGNEKSLNGFTTPARFLAPMLTRGTAKHTRQQLQDELDKLGARLSLTGSGGQLSVGIQAKRNTLPDVLKLLTEVLREPTFPADEFDILKREYIDDREKDLVEPTQLAIQALRRKLSPYPKENIRYVPTVEEDVARLKAVTLDQVKQLYKEQLGGQAGELAIAGDFEPEPNLKLIEGMLRDWKSSVPYERIANPAKTDVPGSQEVILTPDKANAVYMGGFLFALTDADPDFAKLEIANFLFGGGTLSSRLGNRVRQKEGLSYGIQSIFGADAKDPSARFLVYAICNPMNIDKVHQAIAEETQRLLKEGVETKEVDEAKKAYLERMKVQRTTDSRLAGMLSSLLYEGRTMDYYADLEKQISGLTVDDVNAAVRKHITPKRLVIVHAGDFKKK